MDQECVRTALASLPLGGVRWFRQVGSTNDEAKSWAAENCADLSLVAADEQTTGRGRGGRVWISPPGSSLSLSLVLRPHREENFFLPHLAALGALAVKEVLHQQHGLPARIKWPNDILIEGKKLGGVLVEIIWDGTRPVAAVLGIGLNVALESGMLANQFAAEIPIPATSIEAVSGVQPDRLTLLKGIVEKIIAWRGQIASKAFHKAWENCLAYQGEWVQVSSTTGGQPDQDRTGIARSPKTVEGYIIGLSQDGSLRLRTASGQIVTVSAGEVHLRPLGNGRPLDSVFQASTQVDGEC